MELSSNQSGDVDYLPVVCNKGFFGEPKIASFSIDVPRLVVPGALNKAHKKAE
jgi:hypothetical protein